MSYMWEWYFQLISKKMFLLNSVEILFKIPEISNSKETFFSVPNIFLARPVGNWN